MEYKSAKKILEEEAKPLLQSLFKKYGGDGASDPTKDLPDNRYSFLYRKKYCLYLKKFAFYDRAAELLQIILAEEIEYYKIEEEKDKSTTLRHISLEGLSEKGKEDLYIIKPSLLP